MQVNEPERVFDNASDLDLLKEAAEEAGRIALSFFQKDPRTWFKNNKSPVSEADLEVDGYLSGVLGSVRPEYGWLSEESADNSLRLSCRRTFVVDPIDGTRSFLAGGDEWTIAAAVVEDGRPAAAVVFCPVRKEMFTAVRGGGAFLNDVPISVSQRRGIEGASMAGPHSIVTNKQVLAAGLQRADALRSLAYRLAIVAAGRVDVAAARASANDWDLAAADLLVQEAGGRLTDLAGQTLRYNKAETRHPDLIAAPAGLIDPVRKVIKEAVG